MCFASVQGEILFGECIVATPSNCLSQSVLEVYKEPMRAILMPRALGAFLSLVLFCSRATADSTPPQLPADVTLKKDAGPGGLLFVTLRLESGEELPFVVDAGSPVTLTDKSLKPRLGNASIRGRSGWLALSKNQAAIKRPNSIWEALR